MMLPRGVKIGRGKSVFRREAPAALIKMRRLIHLPSLKGAEIPKVVDGKPKKQG